MTTLRRPAAAEPVDLHTGDHMSREEFHRAYEQTPAGFRAELIGGIVYVASPLRLRHSSHHIFLGGLFLTFQAKTPGTQAGDNATVLLGEEGEPQPDLFLRILPEFGGQSRTTPDDYLEGAPELIAEVAYSSRSIDLHAKRHDYTRYGVLEYLVLTVNDRRLRWFDLRADRELAADADGVLRVRAFPGFWLDSEAILSLDHARAMVTLEQGSATPEHAALVRRLAAARSSVSGG